MKPSLSTFSGLYRRDLLAAAIAGGALPFARLAQAQPQPTTVNEVWTDAARQRDIPVKVRWPSATAAVPPQGHPVVIFSHGLGGTTDSGTVWGEAWASAGFVVLHLQHAGSDLPAVLAVASSFSDRAALRTLISAKQLLSRLQDVSFALDEVARRHTAARAGWARVRPAAVGLSGHSYGARTALGMAGQHYAGFAEVNEPRLASFIAFSPTLPVFGNVSQAFARLTRPVLCVTGTRDDDVVGVGATAERRMGVFAALPAGGKAHLVLKDADHQTFGGQRGRAVEMVPRALVSRDLQAQQHAVIAALTTDWWRATLLQDAEAMARLDKPAGLAPDDLFERR